MGSGVLPLAMATRPCKPSGGQDQEAGIRSPETCFRRLSEASCACVECACVLAERWFRRLRRRLPPWLSAKLPLRLPPRRNARRFDGSDPGPDTWTWMVLAAGCGRSKPIERLVPVGCAGCPASTSGLSTWWSTTALKRDLVLRRVSRLDAFSGYPVRT